MHGDLDGLPFGLVRVSAANVIVDANAWFLTWAGASLGDLRGLALDAAVQHVDDDLLPGDDRSGPLIMRHVAAPGRAVMVSRHADDDGALLVVTEASERYRALSGLRASYALADRTATRLGLIIESSIAVSTASDASQLAAILAETAARAYRAEYSVVVLRDSETTMLHVTGSSPLEGFPPPRMVHLVDRPRRVVAASTPGAADALSPGLGAAMEEAGIHAILAAPIHHEEVTFGAFLTFFAHDRRFDQEAAPLAEALAGQAAQALTTLELQSRLAHAATHDDVTGLPNRRMLEKAARNADETVAVIFVDVDDFKAVNDTHGHHRGDAVLREVGRRLREIVRETDIVARYGGDEFVIIADVRTSEDASEIADRICESLREAYPDLPLTTSLGASVGVVVAPPNGRYSLDRLVRAADQAMYRAKSAGGNTVSFGSLAAR